MRGSRSPCPHREQLVERLPAVLEAVYGAYAIDWQVLTEAPSADSLSAEALHLAMTLTESLPDEPEVLGLAALICLAEARRPARRDADGCFVPLDDQDPGALGSGVDRRREKPCWPARTDMAGPDGSSTRRPSSPRTAAGSSAPRSTRSPCARCIERWFGWLPRSAPGWRWRPSTAPSTGRRRDCAPSTICTAPVPIGSNPRGRCARTFSIERGGPTRRPRRVRRAIELAADPAVVAHLSKRLPEANI